MIEFVADKIPWIDTLWDGVHTAIRPLGGALIAVTTLGEASPARRPRRPARRRPGRGSHLTKADAGHRQRQPEPFSNWMLSLFEDAFVFALAGLALKFPALAFVVVLGLLALLTSSRWRSCAPSGAGVSGEQPA